MSGIRKLVFGLIWLIVFLLALVGVADNSAQVSLTYLEYSTPPLPIAWWIILAFMIGALVGYLLSLGRVVRSKLDARKSHKQLASRESELADLRVDPVTRNI